jgi:hypothetical protein
MNKAEYDFADLFDFALLPAHLEEPVVKGLSTPADYNKHTNYSRNPTGRRSVEWPLQADPDAIGRVHGV